MHLPVRSFATQDTENIAAIEDITRASLNIAAAEAMSCEALVIFFTVDELRPGGDFVHKLFWGYFFNINLDLSIFLGVN